MICKVQTDPNIGRIGLIKVGNHGILFNKGIADSCFLGGLLPSGTMNIYKGKFELKTGESTDLQIYDPSILILFSPLNHNPSIYIIPAQWNDTISALFEGIINLNSNIEGRICLLKKGNTVTIINNSPASKFSYLRISVDVV